SARKIIPGPARPVADNALIEIQKQSVSTSAMSTPAQRRDSNVVQTRSSFAKGAPHAAFPSPSAWSSSFFFFDDEEAGGSDSAFGRSLFCALGHGDAATFFESRFSGSAVSAGSAAAAAAGSGSFSFAFAGSSVAGLSFSS